LGQIAEESILFAINVASFTAWLALALPSLVKAIRLASLLYCYACNATITEVRGP